MAVYEEVIRLKDEVSPAAKSASSSISDMAESTMGLQGELAVLTGGLSVVVEAAAALALGFGALVVAGAAFAVSSAQAKKQMISMFDAMGGGVTTGAELDEMLSNMADEIGITKDELAPLTKSFLQMGIAGKDSLEKLTKAAISAQAIVGDPSGAKAFESLTKKIQLASEAGIGLKIPTKGLQALYAAGLNVDDVAKQMNMSSKDLAASLAAGTVDAKKFGDAMTDALIKKGAGPLENLGNSFANIKKKFLQDIGDMFEDIDVGPFMKEVKELFGIFSQAQPSGQALKAGIGGFFKEVFSIATKVVPMIKHFFLDMIIFGLQAYIAIKPIVKGIKEIWEQNDGMGKLLATWELLKPALIFVAILIGAVVVAFFAVVAAAAAVSIGIFTLAATIGSTVAESVATLVGWAASAYLAASNFVSGLVKGITDGAALVTGAVTSLADSATGAFKSALGINSPSTVMMGMGQNLAQGAAIGVEDGTPDVHAATSSMATAAVQGAASPKSGSSSAPAGGPITVYVQIDGAGKSAAEITQEMVASCFESMRLASGV